MQIVKYNRPVCLRRFGRSSFADSAGLPSRIRPVFLRRFGRSAFADSAGLPSQIRPVFLRRFGRSSFADSIGNSIGNSKYKKYLY